MSNQVRNERLSDEEFFRIRNEEVLPQWETGKAIQDLDECIAAARQQRVELAHPKECQSL